MVQLLKTRGRDRLKEANSIEGCLIGNCFPMFLLDIRPQKNAGQGKQWCVLRRFGRSGCTWHVQPVSVLPFSEFRHVCASSLAEMHDFSISDQGCWPRTAIAVPAGNVHCQMVGLGDSSLVVVSVASRILAHSTICDGEQKMIYRSWITDKPQ